MANEGWAISIQVMDDSLHQQVDQTHVIHVNQVVQQQQQPLVTAPEPISQFEIVGIEEVNTDSKEDIIEPKIKNWPLFRNTCRLCSHESTDFVQIFSDEGVRLRLPEIIPLCLRIMLTENDALPQIACRTCVLAVQQSHNMMTVAKESDSNFRKLLVQSSDVDCAVPDEITTQGAKKTICYYCKQHFDQLDELQPHIITIAPEEVTISQDTPPQIVHSSFTEPNKYTPPTQNNPEFIISEYDGNFSKPRRKYNTRSDRNVEEPQVLKESKLRPRKKGKAMTKRNPPRERLPLPEIHCKLCSGVFHKKESYVKHYLLQHKLYLCNDCERTFERHEEMAAHSLEEHSATIPPERYHHPPGAPPVCTFCTKEFKSISGLCHHIDSLHLKIPGNFLCNQCGKPFYGKKKLELHMMRHTGIKTVMCQDCGKMFYNESTLKIHSEMHSLQRKYKCTQIDCDKTFKHWRNLYAHMHTVHGRKWNYACNACPQSYKTSLEAAEHYETHTQEERDANRDGAPFTKMSPYECRICFKHYSSQLHYTNHMKTHENPATSDANARNFECPTCCKRFKSKHYLKIHLGVHMTMKPFCCQYCGKSFITKMLLQTHERIHTNETPFRCEICGKGFRAQKKLQIHKRDVHDKIKNFLCLTCGKAFSRKNHLDAHIRTHTNERPFQCDICGQGFKQVGDMRRHVARHQNHPQPLYKPQPHYKPPYKHPNLPPDNM